MEKINLTAKQIEYVMNCFCRSSTCHQKDNTSYCGCPCKCYYATALFTELIDKEKLANTVMTDAQKLIDHIGKVGPHPYINYGKINYDTSDCNEAFSRHDISKYDTSEHKYFHSMSGTEIKEISDRISANVSKEIERQFEEIKKKK